MVAAFQTEWDFGGTANSPGSVEQNVGANLRFNNEDTNDQDTASPVTIPSGADVFSFWKQIYLACRTTAPDTKVDNVKIYTDATLGWTDCIVNVGNDVLTHNTGSDAGYDPGQALVMTTHDTVSAETDFFTFTSGAPRTVTISETSTQIDAIGEFTDYVCLNLQVGNTAVQGTQAAETVTWQYDEI